MNVADTAVLIPMKRFALAKSRLRPRLSDVERAALGRAMFERVLTAASGCERVCETWVLTNGDDVAQLARRHGTRVLHDPLPLAAAKDGPPLGALIDWSLGELTAHGARRVVVLMADLPHIEARDLGELIAALDHAALALTADQRGASTNALALHLPFGASTAFGDPQSYATHLRRARELGLRVVEVPNPRIAHDVDTPDDLPGATDALWISPGPDAAASDR